MLDIEHARTVAVNTLVVFEIFYLFNSRYITASVFNRAGLTGNRYVLIAIGVLIILPAGFYLPCAHAVLIWHHGNRLQYMVTHPGRCLLCIIPG